MNKIYVQAITESGSCVYTEIRVKDDYSMNDVIRALKAERFTAFRIIDTMKVFVKI